MEGRRASLPRTIKVGPHLYRVRVKPESDMPEELGSCDFESIEIRLRKGMDRTKQQEVVLHELLHACGYPRIHESESLDIETFVDTTAPLLLSTLQDNPKLMDYLKPGKVTQNGREENHQGKSKGRQETGKVREVFQGQEGRQERNEVRKEEVNK